MALFFSQCLLTRALTSADYQCPLVSAEAAALKKTLYRRQRILMPMYGLMAQGQHHPIISIITTGGRQGYPAIGLAVNQGTQDPESHCRR